jgi:hypothetical protein
MVQSFRHTHGPAQKSLPTLPSVSPSSRLRFNPRSHLLQTSTNSPTRTVPILLGRLGLQLRAQMALLLLLPIQNKQVDKLFFGELESFSALRLPTAAAVALLHLAQLARLPLRQLAHQRRLLTRSSMALLARQQRAAVLQAPHLTHPPALPLLRHLNSLHHPAQHHHRRLHLAPLLLMSFGSPLLAWPSLPLPLS